MSRRRSAAGGSACCEVVVGQPHGLLADLGQRVGVGDEPLGHVTAPVPPDAADHVEVAGSVRGEQAGLVRVGEAGQHRAERGVRQGAAGDLLPGGLLGRRAPGCAARQVAARRSPASVASRASSASISAVPGGAPADQPAQQPPAQLGVHREAVHRARTRPAARRAAPGRPGGWPRPRRPASRRAGGPSRARPAQPGRAAAWRPCSQAGRAPGRVGVPAQRRAGLAQQRLHDGDVGRPVHPGQHQADVVAGGHLGVPAHVPRGGPAQRGGQRFGELADPGDQRGQRVLDPGGSSRR